jgi:hypothetical protein
MTYATKWTIAKKKKKRGRPNLDYGVLYRIRGIEESISGAATIGRRCPILDCDLNGEKVDFR